MQISTPTASLAADLAETELHKDAAVAAADPIIKEAAPIATAAVAASPVVVPMPVAPAAVAQVTAIASPALAAPAVPTTTLAPTLSKEDLPKKSSRNKKTLNVVQIHSKSTSRLSKQVLQTKLLKA